jgi:hypothetical protein
MPDSNIISFYSEAKPELKIFVQALPDCGMKFHVIATAAGEPLAFGYSHKAAVC